MSGIVARRQLLEAANALVKTNAPELEHYEALLAAVASVCFYDTSTPCKCVLVTEESVEAAERAK